MKSENLLYRGTLALLLIGAIALAFTARWEHGRRIDREREAMIADSAKFAKEAAEKPNGEHGRPPEILNSRYARETSERSGHAIANCEAD